MHYLIDGLGVFTFIVLAGVASIPLLWTIFSFWFGFYRKIREGRAAIRKIQEATRQLKCKHPGGLPCPICGLNSVYDEGGSHYEKTQNT